MLINIGFRWLRTFLLAIFALGIWCFSAFPLLIERYYSSGFYVWFSSLLRLLQGNIPFSIGDILYAIAIVWLIKKAVTLIILLFNRRWNKKSFLNGLHKTINRLLWLYIIFNVFWGLNYDRPGIAYQLKFEPAKYDTSILKRITADLLKKVNDYRLQVRDEQLLYPGDKEIFKSTAEAYVQAQKRFPFLFYKNPSIKRSLFSEAGNYLGYLGYYNPISGEAQVNVKVPEFLIPYISCHEVAHQLGYASESEANFVGYLAAKSSNNKLFNYSVYFDLFNYANNELFYRDSMAARANYKQLDTLVKLDIKAYRKYVHQYKNPIEPLVRIFYNNYLKANNQPKGIDSYNEVVAWLIAYQKKYGEI